MTQAPEFHKDKDCIFCKIIAQELPSEIIAESEEYLIIQDIAPKAPVHLLIIPKKHIPDIASLDADDCCMAANMFLIAQQISQEIPIAKDFKLVINNGAQAGQKIKHLHMHFLAGEEIADEIEL
jgi:histidine triad (HIT) family protein